MPCKAPHVVLRRQADDAPGPSSLASPWATFVASTVDFASTVALFANAAPALLNALARAVRTQNLRGSTGAIDCT